MEESSLTGVIAKVLEEKERFGSTVRENAEKVLVEFVSANPTGDLHIGHARNAAVGATLSNILDFAGYDVTREYRSEEHMSELQSRGHLVCRLLLEQKKILIIHIALYQC